MAASSSASVERHGDPKPPPQGFNCRPPRPHAVSCAGLASAGNLVRERFSPETNPCVTATRTTVTVGTGPLDASGEPTGATRTFSLGPLRGCRVAIPAGRRCAGQQVLTETEPEQVVGIIFSCRAPIRSFRFHTSKVNRPALDPFGMVVSTEANVERNGENRPAGFLCTPGNPSAPQSYSCSPFLGGGAAPGDLVRTAFFPRANACDPVQTGVKTGTGPLSPARQPTGTVTVFSLGRLHGCSVALPRRRADSSGGGGSVASGGDANAVVNQRARAG